MQIEYIKIKNFKNLQDFEISFNKDEMKTVLIGQNASGKSNFIEALVLIFKYLDLKKAHDDEYEFEYEIKYFCRDREIEIQYDPKAKQKYRFLVDKEKISNKIFYESKDEFLPRCVFAYYSGLGNSNRLEEHFWDHRKDFATNAMKKIDTSLPPHQPLFHAELIHSYFSLLAFYVGRENEDVQNFLSEHLNILGLESILLTIQEPDWKKNEPKFWGSEGVVRSLLEYLNDTVALSPIREKIKFKGELWKKEKREKEVIYLYISEIEKIRKYVELNKWSSYDFFQVLDTANVSRLINREGIRIRVRKKFASKIAFRDLSEGEQQLLTVLGLMRFMAGEESLFLLDEPDTHLNPYWRWKYLDFIEEIVFDKNKKNSKVQVLMSSHDAITIGGLNKEAVRIFESDITTGKIKTFMPVEDPKGMGVAGILMEIFHLKTTLDKKTQEQLERRRHLESMVYNKIILSPEETLELSRLNSELDNLGFSRVTRDPLYQKFQARFDAEMKYRKSSFTPLKKEEIDEQNELIDKVLKDMMNEEGL